MGSVSSRNKIQECMTLRRSYRRPVLLISRRQLLSHDIVVDLRADREAPDIHRSGEHISALLGCVMTAVSSAAPLETQGYLPSSWSHLPVSARAKICVAVRVLLSVIMLRL
jgi:hypothetical protein